MTRRHMSSLTPSIALTVAVSTILLLSGCASGSPVATSSTPTASATPTASPAVAPLLGGDCSKLLTDSTVQSLLGATAPLQPDRSPKSVSALSPFVVGGIKCSWYFGEQGYDGRGNLDVTIIPSSIATPAELADSVASTGCSDMGSLVGCSISADSAGWWIDGAVAVSRGTAPTAADNVLEALKAAVAGQSAAAIETRTRVSCADLSSAITALPTTTAGEMTRATAFNGAGKAAVAAAARVSSESACTWTSSSGFAFDLTVFPHSPGAYAACSSAPGGTVGTAEGSVATTTYAQIADFGSLVCATDSVNSARLLVSNPSHTWTSAQSDEVTAIAVAALSAVST